MGPYDVGKGTVDRVIDGHTTINAVETGFEERKPFRWVVRIIDGIICDTTERINRCNRGTKP